MKSTCSHPRFLQNIFLNIGAASIVCAALLVLGATPLHAATVNWIAPSQDYYTNTAAWSTSALPLPADTAVVGNATVATGSVLFTNNGSAIGPTNSLTSLLLGGSANANGTFTLNSGQLSITNTGTTALIPGNANPSTGSFIMNGGTLNVVRNASTFFQDSFTPGNTLNSTGSFTLNGGTANFLCGIELGISGNGTLTVNNGTLVDNGWFGVGRGSSATSPGQGTFNLTSGTVYILRNPGTDGQANGVAYCQQGTNGVVNISGGSLYCNAIRFAVGPGTGRTDYETLNVSGGNIYLGSAGVTNVNAAGTHNFSLNVSGGAFHTLDLAPNTSGTLGLASVNTDGTNWTWASTLPVTLTTNTGMGYVTFAPETNRTITLNNVFSGPGGLSMTGPGTLALNGNSGYTGATTFSGGTISGTGSITASSVTVASVVTVMPGTSTTAGTLTLGSSLTLNSNTNIIKLSGDPTQINNAVNDLLSVNGSVSLNGISTVKIVPLAPLSTSSPYTILQYSGATLSSSAAANLHVISDSPRYSFAIVDPSTTPGTVQVMVTGNAANLVWKGGASANPTAWDHVTTNWFNSGTSTADFFYNGDSITFDDTATTNLTALAGSEQPIAIAMANNALAYTFAGAGPLIGSLNMTGTNSLTLAMSNAPAFTFITNNSGAIIFNMQLAGSYLVNAPITDSGGGQGALVKANTNTLVLGGNNSSYTGTIYVTNGVLQYTNANALGVASAPLYVTNGGTLDLNGVIPGLKNFIIAGSGFNGQGALVNNSGTGLANNSGVDNLTLAADTTIGASNRWDVYQNSFHGNGYKLTMMGPGSVILVDVGETSLGDIHVVSGRLGFQGNVTMGDPTKTAVVESNATVTFFANTNAASTNGGEAKNLVLNGGAIFDSGGASNNFNGNIFLSGTSLFGTRNTVHVWGNLGNTNGAGGFVLGTDNVGASSGDLYLDGSNSYSGPTIISNRTLFVGASSSLGATASVFINTGAKLDVSSQSAYTFATGQTVSGAGAIAGNLVFGSGATLAAGLGSSNTASLTLSGGLTLQTGSTNIVTVNRTTSIANSKVIGLASVSIGGTLVVTNYGTAFAGGDAIQLFSSLGAYSGAFTSIVPATPGTGLTWNTSTLTTDGTLRVQSSGPTTTPTNFTYSFANNQLNISWPSNYIGWTLQSETNNSTAAGITSTNWYDVPGSSTTNMFVIPVSTSKASVFYRMVLHQ